MMWLSLKVMMTMTKTNLSQPLFQIRALYPQVTRSRVASSQLAGFLRLNPRCGLPPTKPLG